MNVEEMDNLFTHFIVSERIKLRPHELNGAFEDTILLRLRERCEGKCTRNGYVRRGSVRIFKVSPGQLESNSLNGDVVFTAVFECHACNPARGQTLTATVRNFNKFGVMASAGTRDADEKGGFSHVLSIIIPKHSSTGGAQSVADLDGVAVGDKLVTEIVGVKYELNDPRISVIGRALQRIPQGAEDAPPPGSGQGQEAAAAAAGTVHEDVEDLAGDVGSEDIDDEEETIAAAALAASAPDPDPFGEGEGEDDNDGEDDEDEDEGTKARTKHPATTSAVGRARGNGSAANRKARRDEGADEDDSGLDEETDEEEPDEEEEDEDLGSEDESDGEHDADADTDTDSAAAAATSRKRVLYASKPPTASSAGKKPSKLPPPAPTKKKTGEGVKGKKKATEGDPV